MKSHMAIIAISAVLVMNSGICLAQASGNIGYSQGGGYARASQNERSKRVITREDIPPTGASMFLEASVLMNVKADEHVAVFGIAREGESVAECGRKMDATVARFADELKALGMGPNNYFVDFAAQNKIYAFEVTGETATEKLAGFELKKNISINYKDKSLLDRLVLAASHAEIFDLIKVDYIVKNTGQVHNRLMEEASRVIKQKSARYERLLGIKLQRPQLYAEKPSIYYPTTMYDSYVAAESENVNAGFNRQRYIIQGARKSRTFFFNPLDSAGFDHVINPIVIEPVVQFTLYLKVKYEKDPPEVRKGSVSPPSKPAPKTRI